MEIDITNDVVNLSRYASNVQLRQIPFAASQALNSTAYRVAKERLPRETQKHFMGGSTRWTKQGFRYLKSSKRNLEVLIGLAPGREYLLIQIFGGIRRSEPGEGAIVPSKHSRLTKQGNISRRTRAGYFSQADNARITGGKSSGRFAGRAFIGRPRGRPNAPYGIWQRNKKGLKLLMEISNKPMMYRRRFRYFRFINDEVSRQFAPLFMMKLRAAIK